MFAIRLSFADFVSVAAFALFYFLALRNRRSVERHSRYMLATIFPLIPPSFARLFALYAPGVAIRGPEDLQNFGIALNLSFAVAAIFNIALLMNDLRTKKPLLPFLLAFVSLLVMVVSYHTFGNTNQWAQSALAYASNSDLMLIIAGLAIGVTVVFFGWTFPQKKP
jgi:hypothetical protein